MRDTTGLGFAPASAEPSAMTQVAASAAAQEIQAALVIAQRFPRNEARALERIRTMFSRPRLAEEGLYSYTRGQRIEDLSIRAAEALAQAWGNMRAGTVEVEQRDGESVMEAYAWDLETNTRVSRTFTVRHVRETKKGVTRLTESRDVYETTANQGARRLRACILAAIPGDVVAEARDTLYKTLAGDTTMPREDRIRRMAAAMESEHGVTVAMLEDYLGHRLDATTDHELVRLRGVYQSIRDGVSDVATHFTPRRVSETAVGRKPTSLSEAAARVAGKPGEIDQEDADDLPDELPPDGGLTDEEKDEIEREEREAAARERDGLFGD
mgnify:CR=1 FL=1